MNREPDFESSSSLQIIPGLDSAAMLANDIVGDSEAKPGTGFLACYERLENMRQKFRLNTGTGVRNREQNFIIVR